MPSHQRDISITRQDLPGAGLDLHQETSPLIGDILCLLSPPVSLQAQNRDETYRWDLIKRSSSWGKKKSRECISRLNILPIFSRFVQEFLVLTVRAKVFLLTIRAQYLLNSTTAAQIIISKCINPQKEHLLIFSVINLNYSSFWWAPHRPSWVQWLCSPTHSLTQQMCITRLPYVKTLLGSATLRANKRAKICHSPRVCI